MRTAVSVLSFMTAQALVWSIVVTASLVAFASFFTDEAPDLPKLWYQMLFGGFFVAIANQAWWRFQKRDYQGRNL